MIPPDVRLYTWLDVEDTILRSVDPPQQWPEWFVGARAYWDGLLLRVRSGTSGLALEWLHQLFDPRVVESSHEVAIALESRAGESRHLIVSFEETEQVPMATRVVPSFARPSLVQPGIAEPFEPKPFADSSPAVFAFHSFKGGVGRTAHALAFAYKVAKAGNTVLLIDADFEAPGITWLLQSRLPDPPISFSDLLALVHGEEDMTGKRAVALVADRLQGAHVSEIYVLPAFRSARLFHSLEIRPEHILQVSRDPFFLSSVLLDLGRHLKADAIVIDLRAGLSELAAGLILDPRIHRIFVTTLGGQSVEGTRLLLELVARRAPSSSEYHPLPAVVMNQVLKELQGTKTLADAEEALLGGLEAIIRSDETIPSDVLRGPTWFDQKLLALPSEWDDCLDTLQRSEIMATVTSLARILPTRRAQMAPAGQSVQDLTRSRLKEAADKLVYAEKGEGSEFLLTASLRRMVLDHRMQLPVSVVVGSKGAGKTYTYLQIARRGDWRQFASAAGEAPGGISARICPVLQSQNFVEGIAREFQQIRDSLAGEIGEGAGLDAATIRDVVRSWLDSDAHEGEWREHWLDLMAWTVGVREHQPGAGRTISESLSGHDRIVFLFDGLEDVFQEVASSERQQKALRALLQEVPNWLVQQPERSAGLLVFVRRDMVTAAVRQNAAQLLARYEPYSLKWDRTEALRLVAWVLQQSGEQFDLDLRSCSQDDLAEALVPLWGRKLGTDKSREGRSAEWVIAALSDFKGQIQARDIVRFLLVASGRSINQTQWPGRILTPAAIRLAIAECSESKIAEIALENPPLGVVFDRLKALPESARTVPFPREQVGLQVAEVQLLELNGVVVAEEDQYFMPEIFRRGLDFRYSAGARPKVLALARRQAQKTA